MLASTLDFIDPDAIDNAGIPYPAIDRLPLATYQEIKEYARHGGIVIAAHSLLARAPGVLQADSDGRQIREISQRLFQASNAAGHFISDEKQLGSALATYLPADVILSPRTPRIGFIHPAKTRQPSITNENSPTNIRLVGAVYDLA
jgi:hypothetical protein